MSEQLPMWHQTHNAATGIRRTVPVDHGARHGDPDSSHVAITRLKNSGRLQGQRLNVLRELAKQAHPCSTRDLAKGHSDLHYLFARRLPELRTLGYADAIDALPAQLWRITSAGRAALGRVA